MCLDIECKKASCKDIKCKRYFLPLIFTPVAALHPEVFNFYYFPLVVGFSAFILFWNFPKIVYYTASRPLYYEDLFIDEKKLPNYDVNLKVKHKFECIFVWVLIITNTLLVAGLSEYWLFKSMISESYMEIIGISGGIIKIFQIINNTVCRIMLKVLKTYVKEENKKFEQLQARRVKSILNLKQTKRENILEMVEADLSEKSKTRERVQSI